MHLGSIWRAAFIAAVAVLIMIPLCRLYLDFSGAGSFLTLLGTALILNAKIDAVEIEPLKCVIAAFVATMLFAFISTIAGIASYVAASVSIGYYDDMLVHADTTMGFDWRRAYNAEVAHPSITAALRIAYQTLPFQPIVILSALAVGRQYEHSKKFIIAFGIMLIISLAIFPFVAAKSAIVQFFGDRFSGYMPFTNVYQKFIIDGLRDGSITKIPVVGLAGLIGFPSVHAASALLYSWAAWPIRLVRLPILVVSTAMLISTPVEGAHYIVDVMAGLAIAATAIIAVEFGPSIAGRCGAIPAMVRQGIPVKSWPGMAHGRYSVLRMRVRRG